MPIAQNPDVRVRLNAAIICAGVARKTGGARLTRSTAAFLKDPSDAVALWGLQSAKYVIPALVANTNVPMAVQISKKAVEAAKAHSAPSVV